MNIIQEYKEIIEIFKKGTVTRFSFQKCYFLVDYTISGKKWKEKEKLGRIYSDIYTKLNKQGSAGRGGKKADN